MLVIGSDFLFILFSYSIILRSVKDIASCWDQPTAFSTYVSHILAILVFYVSVLGLSIVHRFTRHSSPFIYVIISNVYILFLPLMNPVIYSIKTHQDCQAIINLLSEMDGYLLCSQLIPSTRLVVIKFQVLFSSNISPSYIWASSFSFSFKNLANVFILISPKAKQSKNKNQF